MERYRPYGYTVTTLEVSILKPRTLEMVLVLFYVESLKGFIISSVKITERLRKVLDNMDPKTNSEERISFRKTYELLILEGVTTQKESVRLKEMINYRSTIGHEIHRITIDIRAYLNLAEYGPPNGHRISKYDYPTVQRI